MKDSFKNKRLSDEDMVKVSGGTGGTDGGYIYVERDSVCEKSKRAGKGHYWGSVGGGLYQCHYCGCAYIGSMGPGTQINALNGHNSTFG